MTSSSSIPRLINARAGRTGCILAAVALIRQRRYDAVGELFHTALAEFKKQ